MADYGDQLLEEIRREIGDIRRAVKGDEFSGAAGALERLDQVERRVEEVETERMKEGVWRKAFIAGLGLSGGTGIMNIVIQLLSGGGAP